MLPAAQAELPYWEWARLVSGLMDDTPLGRVVAVRSETDRERIKTFSAWQKRERNAWVSRRTKRVVAQMDEPQWKAQMASLERMIASAFGGGG